MTRNDILEELAQEADCLSQRWWDTDGPDYQGDDRDRDLQDIFENDLLFFHCSDGWYSQHVGDIVAKWLRSKKEV